VQLKGTALRMEIRLSGQKATKKPAHTRFFLMKTACPLFTLAKDNYPLLIASARIFKRRLHSFFFNFRPNRERTAGI
jgi:hypothetical protein